MAINPDRVVELNLNLTPEVPAPNSNSTTQPELLLPLPLRVSTDRKNGIRTTQPGHFVYNPIFEQGAMRGVGKQSIEDVVDQIANIAELGLNAVREGSLKGSSNIRHKALAKFVADTKRAKKPL